MQVNITENLHVEAGQAEVWHLLRDTKRLASLIPGVQSIAALEEHRPSALAGPGRTPASGAGGESYAACIVESIGPF